MGTPVGEGLCATKMAAGPNVPPDTTTPSQVLPHAIELVRRDDVKPPLLNAVFRCEVTSTYMVVESTWPPHRPGHSS